MTGGSDADLVKINRNLAEAAEAENVAFAVGSQRVQLKDKDAKKSFNIRDIAPNILLLANIGAVQLNYGITHQECNELINSISKSELSIGSLGGQPLSGIAIFD